MEIPRFSEGLLREIKGSCFTPTLNVNMVKKAHQLLTQLSGILESGNQESLAKTAGPMKGNFS